MKIISFTDFLVVLLDFLGNYKQLEYILLLYF
jgi:hypothetical protein